MHVKTDLNLLRILVELYDRRNVGQVAKSLRQSQPTISAALKKLRLIFNDPLFVKTPHGMEPTVRATKIVRPIRESLGRIDDELAADVAFEPETATNRFTVALSDIGEPIILPRVAESIRALAPNTTIQVVAPTLSGIEQGLERGDIHLALGYRPDLKRTNYYQQRLFASGYVCLMRTDHIIRGDRLDVAQFTELSHVMLRADNRAQEELEQFFGKRRMKRRVYVETPHIMTVPLLLARLNMIATLPEFLARHIASLHPQIKVVVPAFNLPSVDVKQYWHRRFHQDPATRWLRQLVAKACESLHGDGVRIESDI
jgi:DNA-binding transcriptional LysR family regulator